eukprot:scaffold21391_cov67-Phaeocystis_antarctica.AAC.5
MQHTCSIERIDASRLREAHVSHDCFGRKVLQLAEVIDVAGRDGGSGCRDDAVAGHDRGGGGLGLYEGLQFHHGLLRSGDAAVEKPGHRGTVGDDGVTCKEGLAALVPHEQVAMGLSTAEVLCDHRVVPEREVKIRVAGEHHFHVRGDGRGFLDAGVVPKGVHHEGLVAVHVICV